MSQVKRFNIEADPQDGPASLWRVDSPDGECVSYEEHAAIVAALQEQVLKLAAENSALMESVDHAAGCIHAAEVEGLADALEQNDGERLADLIHRRLCHAHMPVETPATDAMIREIGAKAVNAFGIYHNFSDKLFIQQEAQKYAAKILAGGVS